MDSAAILALNTLNLTKSDPTDRIIDTELRAVIAAILAGEATQDSGNTGTVTFQSVFGTLYTAIQTNPAITVSAPGDNIGWQIIFKHNAASITLSGATLINASAYLPNEDNYIRCWVEDTGVINAEVVGTLRDRITNGNQSLIATSSKIEGYVNSLKWLDVQDVSGPYIQMGLPDDPNGIRFVFENISSAIRFQVGVNQFFTFNMINGAFQIFKLASTEPDGIPVKMLGVTNNGTVVKSDIPSGGGDTDLSQTASPTTVTVESSTGDNVDLPLATTTNAGLLSPADKTKLDDAIDINGTGLTVGDMLRWDGSEFVRDPFIINDAAGADISCSSIKGSIYGGTTARTEGAITISDSVAGGNAFLRVQNATAGGPTFTFTGGGTVTKVGDWTNGYDTTDINHITLVAVSTSLVYAYLSGVE